MAKKKDKAKKPEEWVSLVQERIKQAEDWTMIRQMQTNLNYYMGNQWIVWDTSRKSVAEAPRNPNEERIAHNVIKPRVMTKLSKVTKNRIKWDVRPDTNSQERIEIAKASRKALRVWWDEQEMDVKTKDIFLKNFVQGWCVAKPYFDPEAGENVTPNEDEEGYEQGQSLYTGEIVCRICDPLTMFIDPAATTTDEIRWWVERKPRDIDYIEERYGKKVAPDENVNYASSFNTMESGHSFKKNKNMAMVDEMWVAPCKKYPKGLKVTIAGTKVLDADENAGEPPYVIFGDIPTPGKVTYDAFIKDMLPIQRNLNIALTMMATTFKRMGNPLWLIPLGSGVDEEELTNEIGGFVHYNAVGNMKPERAQPPDVPNIFDRVIEYYNRLIDDQSGSREISQGRLPAGLDTFGGLQLMAEQENEKLTVPSQNYELGMEKVLKRVLRLMKKHYTEERMFKIVGEDGEVEVLSFIGSDLSGEEEIDIIMGSSLPESKAMQESKIMQLWSAGAIVGEDKQPDHSTFLRLLGMGDTIELFEMHQLDENRAKMENKTFVEMLENPELLQVMMEYEQQKQVAMMVNQKVEEMQQQGMQIEPEPVPPVPPGMPHVRDFQDHQTHIYHHNVFRKSSQYDELPPEIQAMVDAHVAEHEQIIQAPMMEQQQQQMMQQQERQATQAQEGDKKHQQQLERDALKMSTDLQRAAMKGGVVM